MPLMRDNTGMATPINPAPNTAPFTKERWNARVRHPLQSWEWGVFRTRMGIDVVRHDAGQLTFHRIPATPWTIGYLPKGPLPNRQTLQRLRRLGQEKRAICITIEPDVPRSEKTEAQIAALPLIPSHHPLFTKYTFILDLTKSEEELLRAMHPKTRYNLKVAKKHGVIIREDNSQNAFAAYMKLTAETTRRQGFYAHNSAYHETMWDVMHKAGIARLFTAEYHANILAAWIVFSWGKTLYYPYGTSSRQYREVMAPTLLLWEIALWGKRMGYEAFDLWGALSEHPDNRDPWYGFHRFKQGFAPRHVEFIGSFDLVIHPFLYRMYTTADTLRWTLLRLLRR